MILSGRRAVVTGATGGIGQAIARALEAGGASSLLVARNTAALSALAKQLPRATPYTADLSDAEGPSRVAAAAPGILGGTVDILINNAGIFAVAPIENTGDDVLGPMIELNITAPFRLMRAFLPAMRAQRMGHLISIGSVADRAIYRGNAAYASTKFGARALHEVARAELHGSGVRATLIAPGPTDTPLWDAYDPDHTEGFTPRRSMLRPEQVADAVVWALTRDENVNIDELRLSHS